MSHIITQPFAGMVGHASACPMKWLVVVVMAAVLASPAAAQIGRKQKNCTACHGIDDYAFYALDRAGWRALLETKHKTAGIVLSEEDRNTLLDWLVAKFGPDLKPFPRTYIPPEITTFFSDLKPRDFSIGPVLRVTGLIEWSRRGIPKSDGG